jgi:hypothetical protein
MAGTAAAALGTGGGDKFRSAFETERRDFLAHFPALTFRTFYLRLAVENDLFEIFPAIFTMIFKNWHGFLLCSIISAAGGENKRKKKGKRLEPWA